MSDTNNAAWQPHVGVPLEVGPAEKPVPGENEILVRNRAMAINPVDWILQDSAIFPWLDYPVILGSDVAGEVAAIGGGVAGFKVGDRVLGQSVGATTNQATHGAFQAFTLVMANMASAIPPSMSFEDAAVIPLGFGTAACGLFQKDHLGLHHPSLSSRPTGETVLVWGGSSSVGCNAIQTNHIFGTSLKDNEVSGVVYGDFLPAALSAGSFRPAPAPRVVASGLTALQGALQAQKQGVSGGKIVVTLDG